MGRKFWRMPKAKQELFDRADRHAVVHHELSLVRRNGAEVLRCLPCSMDLITGVDDVITVVCFILDSMGQPVLDQRQSGKGKVRVESRSCV
jgi:hypothetical protein